MLPRTSWRGLHSRRSLGHGLRGELFLATKVVEDESVALHDLLLQVELINLEKSYPKAELAFDFKIFAIYASVKIRYNKSPLLTLTIDQIVVGFFNDIAQD